MNARQTVRAALGVLAIVLARPALAEDVVRLRNGGQLRGLVIEESPTVGVKIQLADGRVRTLAPEEVFRVEYDEESGAAPAPVVPATPAQPPPPTEIKRGRVVVTSNEPGRVRVDGAESGRTPLDLEVPDGSHTIAIFFDVGGGESRKVFVSHGAPTTVEFQMSTVRKDFARHKEGVRFGASLEPTFSYVFHHGLPYGGGRGTLWLNLGLAPAFDLRAGLFASATHGEFGGHSPFGGVLLARINLTSWYTLSAGVLGGFAPATKLYRSSYDSEIRNGTLTRFRAVEVDTSAVIGPRWSVLGLRFGDRNQFELDVYQSVAVAAEEPEWSYYENGLSLTVLFLPDASPAREARR